MGYNLELRTTKVGGELNIFDSGQVRWITGGVTIDHTTVTANAEGRRILPAGMPIGKITASGKYGPYKPGVTGVKASGTIDVDGATATISGDKSSAYNGIEIKFETIESGDAGATWNGNVLTVKLVDVTTYTTSAIETLLKAATTGAPEGITATKFTVTGTVTGKTGENWADGGSVILAGGVADESAANDGRQNAALMIAEEVDVTEGDKVITAFDWARVISARIPVSVTSALKADLTNITFV